MPILFGEDELLFRQRPVDRKLGIVEAHAEIKLRRVVGIDFVGDLGMGLERKDPVREPLGAEDLLAAFRGELGHNVLAKGLRTVTEVDAHVEDGTAQHAQKLGLGRGRALKMQASKCACIRGVGVVFLDEFGGDSDLGEYSPIVDLRKEAAFVAEARGRQENDIG